MVCRGAGAIPLPTHLIGLTYNRADGFVKTELDVGEIEFGDHNVAAGGGGRRVGMCHAGASTVCCPCAGQRGIRCRTVVRIDLRVLSFRWGPRCRQGTTTHGYE